MVVYCLTSLTVVSVYLVPSFSPTSPKYRTNFVKIHQDSFFSTEYVRETAEFRTS